MPIYNRYQKLQKYYLGEPVSPPEYKQGSLITTDEWESIDECENNYEYRWIDTDETMCQDGNKYKKQIKQKRLPGGEWEYVVPEQYQIGELLESNSFDCTISAGYILFYDEDNNKLFFEQSSYINENVRPIGVVVVPQAHNVYGDNSIGVMSLEALPDSDMGNDYGYMWSSRNTKYLDKDYNKIYTSDINDIDCNFTNFLNASDYIDNSLPIFVLPIEFDGYSPGSYVEVSNPCDISTFYHYRTNDPNEIFYYLPSPYIGNDRNEIFYKNDDISTGYNILSDFEGLNNTSLINKNYSPATYQAYNYSTRGTKSNDWYLPACGEVCYYYARFKTIFNAIKLVKNNYQYNSSINMDIIDNISDNFSFMTSTEITNSSYVEAYLGFPNIRIKSKNKTTHYNCVVPFIRVKQDGTIVNS